MGVYLCVCVCVRALSQVQLFVTPWINCSPPGSSVHGVSQARMVERKSVKIAQLCLTLCDLMDYTVHGILQARILEWVAFSFSGDLPNPGIKSRSPTLQVDSLPAEPLGKPKNTGMGSLSLLQRIFLTRNQTMVSCIAGGYFPTELSGKPKIKNKTSLKRTKFITPKDAKVMQSINRPKSLL